MIESLADICTLCDKKEMPFWRVILEDDMQERGIDENASVLEMRLAWQAMKESIRNYDPKLKSRSGLAGSDGARIEERRKNGRMICGDLIARVMERALKVSESNACMKRIVAAPTAGSCGVIPAVFLTVQEAENLADEEMIKALYVAGGIGGVIAARASLAGATGGCQAEIGSASSMAAGGVAFLCGGTPEDICHASALAMKGLLGLVCDPAGGLVEVPCIKRNVIGAVNAITSADMALAGIRSRILPDEVFDAMRSVGRALPEELRETSRGGLAVMPSARQFSPDIS